MYVSGWGGGCTGELLITFGGLRSVKQFQNFRPGAKMLPNFRSLNVKIRSKRNRLEKHTDLARIDEVPPGSVLLDLKQKVEYP